MVGKGVILSEIRLAETFNGYQAWGAPDCRKMIAKAFKEWRARPLEMFWKKRKNGWWLYINVDPDDLAGGVAGQGRATRKGDRKLRQNSWSEEETEFLLENYAEFGPSEAARFIKRSKSAISARAHKLGIRCSDELQRRLRQTNLGNRLGRSK